MLLHRLYYIRLQLSHCCDRLHAQYTRLQNSLFFFVYIVKSWVGLSSHILPLHALQGWRSLKRQTRATYGCMVADQSPWMRAWAAAWTKRRPSLWRTAVLGQHNAACSGLSKWTYLCLFILRRCTKLDMDWIHPAMDLEWIGLDGTDCDPVFN